MALFFGGWHLPWVDRVWTELRGNVAISDSIGIAIFRSVVFFGKTTLVLFIFLWTRWSLPRFRFDQIMNLAWRMLIPLSLMLVIGTAIGVYVGRIYFRGDTVNGLHPKEALGFLLVNLSCAAIAYIFAKFFAGGRAETNRRIKIEGSRFTNTALPAGVARPET
ncbi:MAG TPA: NADH-quinone oxidoreductase subunit H [Tepidisphaeraceae bacterium]|nr:NADH-quinone oxidoreductase subunit H [Tepidisphaeraceae bacterium]